MKKNKKYTEEFKKQAVELAERLGSTSQAARQLGITDPSIHGWKRKYGKDQFEDNAERIDVAESETEELRRLRKEVLDLKKVNHILKQAAAFFSQDHLK